MINISTAFILQHLKNDMVYRKPFRTITTESMVIGR